MNNKQSTHQWRPWLTTDMDRRVFLKAGAALAAASVGAGSLFTLNADPGPRSYTGQEPDKPDSDSSVKIVYTSCLMCRSDCGIRAKVIDGVLVKLDGSPYHPNNNDADELLAFSTEPSKAKTRTGRSCAKAQAGIEILYDPLRIKTPLKRAGLRGSDQWKAITWDQAIKEIVEGGDLFGEGHVEGLRAIRNLVSDIDAAIPELGKRANQLVFMAGRIEELERDFSDRFFRNCYGTINFRNDHTSICELARHRATNEVAGVNHMKPDIVHARYLILFGTNPFDAGFPMITFARRLVNEFRAKNGRLVVVDPRFSSTAAKADRWVPVKPGGDGALAMGMIHWMLENHAYDEDFLRTPSSQAANARYGKDRLGRAINTHNNAAHLVIVDPNHNRSRKLLRASDAGISGGTDSQFVVVVDDKAVASTSINTLDQMSRIQLEFDGTVNGIAVKSVFALLKEEVNKRTRKQYAEIAGLEEWEINDLAEEFSSYGRRAVAENYRGAGMHTKGFYNAWAIWLLNILAGNPDRVGGWAAGGGGFASMTGKVNLATLVGGANPKGINIARSGVNYTPAVAPKLIARDGYPPKRPFYPRATGDATAWQDILPSIDDAYPYPIKALITYYNNVVFTAPAQREVGERVLKDLKKVPLFVAIDVTYNETTALADYILPNVTYLEKWGAPGLAPTILQKSAPWRQPVVGTYDKGTSKQRDASDPFDFDAPNIYTPINPETRLLEDILIDIGKRLDLPGFGNNAFADGSALDSAWDWYKKALENIVFNAKAAGLNLSGALEVIQKGGVFTKYDDAFDIRSGFLLNRLGRGRFDIYSESLATEVNANTVTKWDSATGKPLDGEYFKELPDIQVEPVDIRGNPVIDSRFPLQMVTYKPAWQTQSRTIVAPSLQMHMPENFIEINAQDARKRKIATGDLVILSSASNPTGVKGRAQVTEGLRPSVVAVSNSYGHWQQGARAFTLDGKKSDFDPSRGLGITCNLVMRLDPVLKNVTLTEAISGSASFFDTYVEVTKA